MGRNKSKTQKEAAQRADLKEKFIQVLAEYLSGNQAEMSIRLQMGYKDAQTWAKIRSAVPTVFGYPTVPETVTALRRFLA